MNPPVHNWHRVSHSIHLHTMWTVHTAPNSVITNEMNDNDDCSMVGELRQPHQWMVFKIIKKGGRGARWFRAHTSVCDTALTPQNMRGHTWFCSKSRILSTFLATPSVTRNLKTKPLIGLCKHENCTVGCLHTRHVKYNVDECGGLNM